MTPRSDLNAALPRAIATSRIGARAHIFLIALLVLAPVAGLRAYDILAVREASLDAARASALSTVRDGADGQRELIRQASAILTLTSEVPEVADPDAAACSDFLKRVQAQLPWAMLVFAARPDGEVTCWSYEDAPSMTLRDRDDIRKALATRDVVVSDFLVMSKTGQPAVTLTHAVRDGHARIKSVVGIAIALDWMGRLVADASRSSDTLMMMVDRRGTVLASSDRRQPVGRSVAENPVVNEALRIAEGTYDGLYPDGETRIGASTTIPGSDARLIVGRSKALVLASVGAEATRSLLLLLVLIAVAGLLAWTAAELFFLRWIRRLTQAAKQLGDGDFDVRPMLPAIAGELKLVGDALGDAGLRLAAREAELASTDALFRGLFDHSPDVQVVHRVEPDGSFAIETWNPVAAAVMGVSCDEARGKQVEDVLHPEDAALIRADIERAIATGEVQRREDDRIAGDRPKHIWEILHIPLIDAVTGRVTRVFGSARDIQHIRQAETEAREANRLLRMAEGVAHVGHWRVDLPAGRVFWSDEIYRIHGREPAFEPDLASGIAAYHPDDRSLVEEQIGRAVENDGFLDFTARLVRPDGEVRSVLVRGFCQKEEDDAQSLFGVIMDVTELRRVEARLRDNAATLKVTLDNMDQGLFMVDPGGRMRVSNQRALELLDLPAALMASHPQLSEVIAYQARHGEFDDLPDAIRAKLEPSTQGTEFSIYERTRPNGTVVEVRTVPLPAGGLVRTFTDVTAHREAEEKIRATEARYRLLAENTSDVITRLNLDFEREYVSPACRGMLGFEPEDLVGGRLAATMHPEDVPAIGELARQLVAGRIANEETTATYRMRHKLGHWVWIEAGMRLVRDEATGEPLSIISSLRDVSERQERNEELRLARDVAELARAAAEKASRAKTDFLASMSHEIRTPLNAIIGFADLLASSDRLAADQKRYADLVCSSGAALLTLVDDILDFSKVEAGAIELQNAPFSPAAAIDNCMSLTRGIAVSKSLEVVARIDEKLPDFLVGDEPRLRQVLLNLLNNAVKFTRDGSVTLIVRHEGSGATGERLRFSVTDTGIGIPKDKQHRLFQRFSQVDGSIKRDFGGTGLGLAICKRLVELMGGEIGVFSELGQGATFWFTLCLPRGRLDALRSADAGSRHANRQGRLLLVEDVEVNQELARYVLEAGGHKVDVVGDGAAAVMAVQDKAYDLVLMDVQMPGMDGLTATQRIRALEHPTRMIPIVAMTANVLPDQIREFRQAGMDDHVGKPFKRAELFATIERWLPSSIGIDA